ncbi:MULTISPECIES: UvrD-helicase domain-containing protein [unclassified Breznakia]|uniref:ATP-dependent helicase n=1 Tax=unclassified Breznakia TaxID=2623764 RepID=UPI0024730CB0|nr:MULTISPECIES: UvrD-helicase domain-containing protein [unclassified Breznakia]MDH6366427.1 DNA helicase-2/ATP-dependent DNA helicase PcrA [Breznakia sp. PH1-1]MDH6403520.1 DNA helicase-2/ATP-dependent DNA helicase PcrA [Breznakia sp. PF1-11]MDH6411229.1 DNA helicase-2/ATP-dependent DNA helicase PcrA [Breznakia sp. PFB1-11]MDH6413508.1 DNA helicase-2/ATP-dependent DNA helicase PcrA [Breznakia sp. PFB1-14]MDH6415774.1 DNA helicase-2/ATP-dependent DNA helicase PcrA [Breznakia sp. PFB1-4]
MNILDGLNAKQKEAVTTIDSHLRIVAGAGSGKTRVITTRIAYLIMEKHVAPYRILAITFTNKAANEMKERVEGILGVKNSGVLLSTIHSLCVRILREEIRYFDYPRNFVILDSDDQKSILRDIYKKHEIELKSAPYAQTLSYISNNKTSFVSAGKAYDMANYEHEKRLATIYVDYEKKLQDMQALDFDDLLLFVYRLFKENVEVREKWQGRYDYIHVDEFQDVDMIQYGIVRYLCGPACILCVVGDPDQTIYTWRGAKVDIIMNFEKDFKGCKSIVLNENYRSTKTILKAANSLIRHNEYRIDKDLYTENEEDFKISFYESQDEQHEGLWIAKKIISLHQESVPYHQMAILYRSNYLSRNLEKVLLDGNIPYRIYGSVKFFERAEIKDALSYLRLMITDNKSMGELAIKRILNVPKRGAGPKTMETMDVLAEAHNFDYFETIRLHPIAKGKTQQNIDAFVDLILKYRKESETMAISIIIRKLLKESGYFKMLEDANETDRLDNINELIHDIETYEENNPEGTLDDYLQMIALYTDTQEEGAGDAVQLMSVHSAKGLEFDNVFVYSVAEGIFPNERSVNEGGKHALEEERRLAYVAFTRARKRLFLTTSVGLSYVTGRMKTTSRFVKELGDDVLNKEGEIFQGYKAKKDDGITRTSSSSIPKSTRKGSLRKGDLITHDAFGDGVVIKISDGVAQIAFDKKFGIKKLAANHHMLHKK